MNLVVQAIGIILIIIAVLYILNPALFKSIIRYFVKGKRIYLAGILRLALAVIFFIAARECKYPWLIGAFGALFLIGASIIFMMKLEKLKAILQWYLDKPNNLLRALGLIVLALGIIIIFSA
jgi:uncharacterized protein YjeT (DUF2065 family)